MELPEAVPCPFDDSETTLVAGPLVTIIGAQVRQYTLAWSSLSISSSFIGLSIY